MQCPDCGSAMIQVYSKWVCGNCYIGNKIYYTSKTFTPSLFRFLNFPKCKNDANIIHAHTITPGHGDIPNWNTIIIIPHVMENIQDININIICDKMTPMGWGWSYGQITPEGYYDKTHIKIEFYPIHGSSTFLANDAKFSITLKFKLEEE